MTHPSNDQGSSAHRRRSRHLWSRRARSEVEPAPPAQVARPVATIVDPGEFAAELAAHIDRRRLGGSNCGVAAISLCQADELVNEHGVQFLFGVVSELVDLLRDRLAPSDLYHVAEHGEVLVLGRESTVDELRERVIDITSAIAAHRWDADGVAPTLTARAGIVTLDDGDTSSTIVGRAVDARATADLTVDHGVCRWHVALSPARAPGERRQSESARLVDTMVLPPQGSALGVPLLARPRKSESPTGATMTGHHAESSDDWGATHTRATLDAIQASLKEHAAAALDAIEASLAHYASPDDDVTSPPAGGLASVDAVEADRPSVFDLPVRQRGETTTPSGQPACDTNGPAELPVRRRVEAPPQSDLPVRRRVDASPHNDLPVRRRESASGTSQRRGTPSTPRVSLFDLPLGGPSN